MPEAIDGVGELGRDRRVDVGVVDAEGGDRRHHLAGELLEDGVLVLHLGDEPCRLEQALAVPAVG